MAREYYRYDPSLPAAVIFTVLFILSAAVHTFQLVKSKTWYFVPFLVGCLFEAIGYIGRAIGAVQTPDWTRPPFIAQILLLLLGPTFFAASIYMILGRLIQLLNAEKHSLIRPSRLTKFFLIGDVTSIAAQGLGGGKLANAETPDERDQAQTIIIVGLAIQIVFFSLFMAVTCVFHYRINKKPTAKSSSINSPWERLLLVLYASSLLILVRSIFRVVEYVTGHDGEIQSKEVYIYIFDALLMAIVAVIFNIFHPSEVLSIPGRHRPNNSDSEMPLGTYGNRH
ncbi:RTA1 like protein-domain-containing protein [Dactylonectria estremocensis]|uniref:RTA1 like protein-domain-containing protein n=1 Tax=Dactylonectria estremocensis TaxID=1079267 RepID=A0A9P9EWD4_9HYPO|nr:RTA1 like protein-domain-containing protein [Dactylonectria estremocensis]